MNGKWLKRHTSEHMCEKPAYDPGVRWGDVWQCDECGCKWAVSNITRTHQLGWREVRGALFRED